MKKLLITGLNESKAGLIATLKAIGNSEVKVRIEKFEIEVSLLDVDTNESVDNMYIEWKGNNNKLQFVKLTKEALGIGLKDAKDIVDNLGVSTQNLLTIEQFAKMYGNISVADLYNSYKESQDSFEEFFEIIFK